MMKTLLITIFLASMITFAGAQTVLLQKEPENETLQKETGPNYRKFNHLYIRGGLLASSDKPGARIVYGTSVNLGFGMRKKYKINSVYSLGFDFEFQYTDYKLRQRSGKIVPDTLLNNIAERIDYSTFGVGFFNRFNLDPDRGNFMGVFFDVGIMGELNYSIKTISKNKLPDGTIEKVVLRKLPFTNTWNSKLFARFGYSHGSVFASYRLMDLFDEKFDYPDMPRLIVGIELGIF